MIGFAGILGGAPVLGMAHRLLPAIGVAVDAAAVGRHYGSRAADGVLDLWVMDSADAASAADLEADGLPVAVTGLIMSSPEATAEFVRLAVKALPRPDGPHDLRPGRDRRGQPRHRPGRRDRRRGGR